MPLLPVNGPKLMLDGGVPAVGDWFVNGFRRSALGVRSGFGLTVNDYSQGLPVDANGALCLFDATLGLPAGTKYQNGYPLSAGNLCVSTGLFHLFDSGVPMDFNGAVCV